MEKGCRSERCWSGMAGQWFGPESMSLVDRLRRANISDVLRVREEQLTDLGESRRPRRVKDDGQRIGFIPWLQAAPDPSTLALCLTVTPVFGRW